MKPTPVPAARDQVRSIYLDGIDCAHCAQEIEKAACTVPGVAAARVVLATGQLRLNLTEDPFDAAALRRRLHGLGYRIQDAPGTGTLCLQVLDSPSKDALNALPDRLDGLEGVVAVSQEARGKRLRVQYDPELTNREAILKAVEAHGVAAFESATRRTDAWWAERRSRLLILSGAITLGTLLLELGPLPAAWSPPLFLAAMAIGGYYPARSAWAGLRAGGLNVNALMVAAAIGAAILSLWEEAALMVFIYSLGGLLESLSVHKTRASVEDLMRLAPPTARVRSPHGEADVPVGEVRVGDEVIIRPGERLPVDGVVVEGRSSVDQAPITGESIPVAKEPGDRVFAGSLNQRGSLTVRTTQPFQETTLARIVHLIEEAQTHKAAYQRFGERFGRTFTPAAFLLALGVGAVPPLLLGAAVAEWAYRALVVLVVSCSCGLAISIPVAVVAALGNAARRGVLIKGGTSLEVLARVRTMVFDKTGTLTLGRPVVTDVVPLDGKSEREVLGIAAAIESRSEHPLADAIQSAARRAGIEPLEAADFQAIPGMGVEASLDGHRYRLTSAGVEREAAGAGERLPQLLRKLEEEGKSTVLLAADEGLVGLIAALDPLRPNARDALAALAGVGVRRMLLLTGDNEGAAARAAREAGLVEVVARALPEDKIRLIRQEQQKGARVAMVGDGVNDAPALAQADVGIAMGRTGSGVALETGHVVLMSDDLTKLPFLIALSRQTIRTMRQNVLLTLAVIGTLIPLALAGKIGLVPGMLINELSALLIIANGLRLLRWKP